MWLEPRAYGVAGRSRPGPDSITATRRVSQGDDRTSTPNLSGRLTDRGQRPVA